MTEVRTRFAPSPTGYLHVGGIRTALFAYLLAKKHQGTFVLRFEDTDKKREVPGSAEHLITSLKALGIMYDEGPDIGGQFAPYIQSQRLESYQTWAKKLIDAGRAYADRTPAKKFKSFASKRKQPKSHFCTATTAPKTHQRGTAQLRFALSPNQKHTSGTTKLWETFL
ncbi:MAG: glutamate--tRNA ligase family protein, partial [Candidatus Saccharimonadales bacterium]